MLIFFLRKTSAYCGICLLYKTGKYKRNVVSEWYINNIKIYYPARRLYLLVFYYTVFIILSLLLQFTIHRRDTIYNGHSLKPEKVLRKPTCSKNKSQCFLHRCHKIHNHEFGPQFGDATWLGFNPWTRCSSRCSPVDSESTVHKN